MSADTVRGCARTPPVGRKACQRRRSTGTLAPMCRNIKTLFNFDPPATEDEIHASSLQFVRKLSGFAHPSKANQAAFDQAVADVSAAAQRLIDSLVTNAEPRDREVEAARAKAKSALRFTPISR